MSTMHFPCISSFLWVTVSKVTKEAVLCASYDFITEIILDLYFLNLMIQMYFPSMDRDTIARDSQEIIAVYIRIMLVAMLSVSS